MAVSIRTPGVHHLALRSSDLERARRFYVDTLGFAPVLEADGIFIFLAGATAVAVRSPNGSTLQSGTFDPYRVGLDHVALTCTDEDELQRVAAALQGAGIQNTGVKLDETLGKQYVAFKDPDRIAWEFYMA